METRSETVCDDLCEQAKYSDSDFSRFRNIVVNNSQLIGWRAAKSTSGMNDAFFLAKTVTCVPKSDTKTCIKCGSSYTDTIERFVLFCRSTSILLDVFWTDILNSFGIPVFLYLDPKSDYVH